MTKTHWTERSITDAMFKIGADFVRQIEPPASQSRSRLADVLGVSKGRVSQVLNNPGNLTLKKMIEYAKALGKRIAIVAYDDADQSQAPINSQIFVACWERAGRPRDFFELEASEQAAATFMISVVPRDCLFDIAPTRIISTTKFVGPGVSDVADTSGCPSIVTNSVLITE